MVATGDSCFWLADFFKSPPLKPHSQMNRNLVGSNYGRSSIEIALSSHPTNCMNTNMTCPAFHETISWSETNYKCIATNIRSIQCDYWTEQVQVKKKTLTGQRRNTILKHLMFQSCDYPHFICISFRQFDCYVYIILWAPYRCLFIFRFNIHLLVSAIY
jgi:hypothetical protein